MAIKTWEMNQEDTVSWKSVEDSFQKVTDGCIVESTYATKGYAESPHEESFLILCNENSCT